MNALHEEISTEGLLAGQRDLTRHRRELEGRLDENDLLRPISTQSNRPCHQRRPPATKSDTQISPGSAGILPARRRSGSKPHRRRHHHQPSPQASHQSPLTRPTNRSSPTRHDAGRDHPTPTTTAAPAIPYQSIIIPDASTIPRQPSQQNHLQPRRSARKVPNCDPG